MRTQRFTATVHRRGVDFAIDVPEEVSLAFAAAGYVPVVGTVNGVSFRGALVAAGGGRHRLFLNAAVRGEAEVGEGDDVALAITRDTTSREPPTPDDLNAALDAVAGARQRWEACSPSTRREILVWIGDAKNPETRARRIARAVAHVMDGT